MTKTSLLLLRCLKCFYCDFISSHGLVLAGTQSGDHLNLVSGHAYSLTGFGGDVNHGKCIRIRNPWGQLENIGSEPNILNHDADGEFVLKWDTFCKHFFCLTVKESVSDFPRYIPSPTPPSLASLSGFPRYLPSPTPPSLASLSDFHRSTFPPNHYNSTSTLPSIIATPPSTLPSSRQRSRSSSISTFLNYLHISQNNIDHIK